jgi:hypothetical protein
VIEVARLPAELHAEVRGHLRERVAILRNHERIPEVSAEAARRSLSETSHFLRGGEGGTSWLVGRSGSRWPLCEAVSSLA